MIIAHLLLALAIALILTAIFPIGLRGYRGGFIFWFFFLLLFLAVWAGGIWVTPLAYDGLPWLGFLLIGLFVALLIVALLPPASPPITPTEMDVKPSTIEVATAVAINVFFWLLLFGLLLAIIVRYTSF